MFTTKVEEEYLVCRAGEASDRIKVVADPLLAVVSMTAVGLAPVEVE